MIFGGLVIHSKYTSDGIYFVIVYFIWQFLFIEFQTLYNFRSIYIGRAETIIHDEYGGKWYWKARRSMRFATHLQDKAAKFRAAHLASSDVQDGTLVPSDWRDTKASCKKFKIIWRPIRILSLLKFCCWTQRVMVKQNVQQIWLHFGFLILKTLYFFSILATAKKRQRWSICCCSPEKKWFCSS